MITIQPQNKQDYDNQEAKKKRTEATAKGNVTTEPSALIALDHKELPVVRYSRLIEARRGLRDQPDAKTSGLITVNSNMPLEKLHTNR